MDAFQRLLAPSWRCLYRLFQLANNKSTTFPVDFYENANMYLIDKFVNATLYIFVQIGLEKMATEHTRLIYMTTGVLLQKLVQAKSLTEFSHIFVDEVHKPDV